MILKWCTCTEATKGSKQKRILEEMMCENFQRELLMCWESLLLPSCPEEEGGARLSFISSPANEAMEVPSREPGPCPPWLGFLGDWLLTLEN